MKQWLWMIPLAGLLLPGCQYFKERDAIKTYSDGLGNVNKLQKGLVALDSNKQLEAKLKLGIAPLQQLLDADVLPKWRAYVKALKALPTGTAKLKAIHKLLVAAQGGRLQALRSFSEGLTVQNLRQRLTIFNSAMHAATQNEASYRVKLHAYYKEFHASISK